MLYITYVYIKTSALWCKVLIINERLIVDFF